LERVKILICVFEHSQDTINAMGTDIKEMALQNMIMKKVICRIDCENKNRTFVNNAIVGGAASPFLPVLGKAGMKQVKRVVSSVYRGKEVSL